MKDFPLVVSYYTKDTFYQLEVQNLIASCEKWGLEHHVEPIPSFGSWERNCSYKPFFLMEKIQQFRRPVFWVDADAVFVKRPEKLDVFEMDFAVRINAAWEDSHPSKVMSGSVFVNATQGGAKVLKLWGQECIDSFSNPERKEEVWDQLALRDVIRRGVQDAKIGALPLEYLTIVDNAGDGKEAREVVIGHYQASRRLKKLINEKP
ncbi:MAG: hypothetical protein JSS60_09260 [Verrucomicrobia bacterium]|nr:hypothetical protein [Verrucomicrobiota bacterium]